VLLAVTAYCTAEDRALCLESGMDAFVGKPLTPEKLRKVLREAGRRTLPVTTLQAAVEPPPPAPARAVDITLLKYLSDGSAQGFDAQVKRFLAALDEAEARLGRSHAARDYPAMRADAHGLRGQARIIGGAALEEACAGYEAAADSRDEERCAELLALVHGEVNAVRAAMHRHLPAAPST
jgi:CheY-like chemotaxis protein